MFPSASSSPAHRSASGAAQSAGAALGGLIVGGFTKLLELDAFSLLIGHSPGNITGAFEGLMVGTGVGVGAVLAERRSSIRHGAMVAAGCGAVAGALLSLLGGHLMLGSLDLLARQLPGSRLSLDNISQLFGETSSVRSPEPSRVLLNRHCSLAGSLARC